MIALLMAAYLSLSLTISAVMNTIYSRLKWRSLDRGSGGKGLKTLISWLSGLEARRPWLRALRRALLIALLIALLVILLLLRVWSRLQ